MNHIEVDWSNYESPITVEHIVKEYERQVEENIIKAIASYNITVDADELVKALRYDRDQYEKGYKEGYRTGYHEGYDKGFDEGYDAGRLYSSMEESE